jgi:N-acetyl-anhydromuramyl-L-alanine amidase AmpD
MVFSTLPSLEERFRRTGNGGEYVLRPIAVPVPHESLTLNGLLCTPAHRSGYYHDTVYAKERIVLHFTAGGLSGDMSTLTRQNYHVSVPFVIARDGTIYQLYSSKFWSGNLGGDALGNMMNAQDKRTIGIEISNYGPLSPGRGGLQNIYGETYCALNRPDAFQKLTVPFRGESYYATYTAAQYDSLIVLLRYLTAQYNIPRQFIPEPKRYVTTPDVLTFRGIVSHVNYRKSGKWDIGPAFDWAQLMAGVQAPAFASTSSRDIKFFDEDILTSEEAMIPLLPQPGPAALEDEPYDEATPADPVTYLRDLEIKELTASFPLSRGLNAGQTTEGTEQSFLNARSLVSFVSDVNGQRRDDVLNSVLLAQLAANRQFPAEDQLLDWYKAFVGVLNKIGWVIEEAEFSTFESSGTVFDVQNAIIDILTTAFGGSFMALITRTLSAIKGLSDSNGKITAFEKNTHSISKGGFQIGLVKEENNTVYLQIGTFMLTSSNEIRRILFFKSTNDKTSLSYCSRTGTLNEEVYATIRSSVQQKLGLKADEFITGIEI